MNYPFWDIPYLGSGWVIGLIAIFHVMISQFAVGGGFYLPLAERKALRMKDPQLRADWLKQLASHSKTTISPLASTAPARSRRCSARSRSSARREPQAFAATHSRKPSRSRPSAVCSTQTCASQPAMTTSVGGSLRRLRRRPASPSAQPSNDIFATVASQRLRMPAADGQVYRKGEAS